jgi:hypothetical protein
VLDQGLDQAAGLRRLMRNSTLDVVAFPVDRELRGSGAWVARVAHSMRALGRRPVVLDGTTGEVSRALGTSSRKDLIDLLRGQDGFEEVAQSTPDGVYVLRAERGIDAFVASGAPARNLFDGFARLSHDFDTLLLVMPTAELACLADPRESVPVVAFEAGAADIASTYLVVKYLCTSFGYARFSLVVHGAEGHGHAVQEHARFSQAAKAFLNADVSLAGWTPAGPVDPTDTLSAMAMRRIAGVLLKSASSPVFLH